MIEPKLHRVARFDRSGGAVFDDDLVYRYLLWRRWADGPLLTWIMLNPSTADALEDDPTIRRVVGFSTAAGYAGCEVVNLWAYRATDPTDLKSAVEPSGPHNDSFLRRHISGAPEVVVAWGASVDGLGLPMPDILEMVGNTPMRCLGVTQSGQPRHPLYIKGATALEDWYP